MFYPMILFFYMVAIARCQSFVGVNYGIAPENLPVPPPSAIVQLLQSTLIGKLRLNGADQSILNALSNTNIEVTVGVTNNDIPQMATDPTYARLWVMANVIPYPSTKIILITLGNDVLHSGNSQLIAQLLPAMQNLQSAINESSLGGKVRVSIVHSMAVLGPIEPPLQVLRLKTKERDKKCF